MSADELRAVLDAHAAWLRGNGGSRADLRGANLLGSRSSGPSARRSWRKGLIARAVCCPG